MKFIRKLDNPSGEMGITHKGKPEGRLLYRHRVVARSKFKNFLSSPINNQVIDYFNDYHFI